MSRPYYKRRDSFCADPADVTLITWLRDFGPMGHAWALPYYA